MALAQRLSAHPLVARVLYPGLPQHPGHDIAARQMENGFGFMLSVQVTGGETAAPIAEIPVTRPRLRREPKRRLAVVGGDGSRRG